MKLVRITAPKLANFVGEFSDTPGLAVNDKIGFYEPCELRAWMSKPKDNLLYAVLVGGRYAGFCFAKVMSPHWAMIDTFYIKPRYRRGGVGSFLQRGVEAALRGKVKYVSRVTKADNAGMHAFLDRTGWAKRDSYVWFDKFL